MGRLDRVLRRRRRRRRSAAAGSSGGGGVSWDRWLRCSVAASGGGRVPCGCAGDWPGCAGDLKQFEFHDRPVAAWAAGFTEVTRKPTQGGSVSESALSCHIQTFNLQHGTAIIAMYCARAAGLARAKASRDSRLLRWRHTWPHWAAKRSREALAALVPSGAGQRKAKQARGRQRRGPSATAAARAAVVAAAAAAAYPLRPWRVPPPPPHPPQQWPGW